MKSFVSAALFLALLCVSPARGETLEQAEAIRLEATSLKAFLANKPLQRRYFEAMAKYMGPNRTPWDAFEAIVGKLKGAYPTLGRDLEERLWKPRMDPQDFYEIQVDVTSQGRLLDEPMWEGYLEQTRDGLREKSRDLLAVNDTARANRIAQAIRDVRNQANELEVKMRAAKNRGERTEIAKGFAKIYESPELKSVEAYLLLSHLESEGFRDLMRSADPDLILDTWRELHQNPRTLTELLPAELRLDGAAVLGQATRHLETVNDLLARKEMFPEEMRQTARGTVPVGKTSSSTITTRHASPFASLLKGLPARECVAGECGVDREGLEHLTLERVLSGALKGSRTEFVEKNGRYNGYTESNAIVHQSTVYGNLHLFAPVLRQKMRGAESGARASTVYETWLRRADARRPEGIAGFIVSESHSFNNAGLTPVLHASSAYLTGKVLGDSLQVAPLDAEFARKVVVHAVPTGRLAKYYGGRMILDATVPDALDIVLLNPAADPQASRDPRLLAQMILEADYARLAKILDAMTKPTFLQGMDLKPLQTEAIREKILSALEVAARKDRDEKKPDVSSLPPDRQKEYHGNRYGAYLDKVLMPINNSIDTLATLFRGTPHADEVIRRLEYFRTLNPGFPRLEDAATYGLMDMREIHPDYPEWLWTQWKNNPAHKHYNVFTRRLASTLKGNPHSESSEKVLAEILEYALPWLKTDAAGQRALYAKRGYADPKQSPDVAAHILLETGIEQPDVVRYAEQVTRGGLEHHGGDQTRDRHMGGEATAVIYLQGLGRATPEMARRLARYLTEATADGTWKRDGGYHSGVMVILEALEKLEPAESALASEIAEAAARMPNRSSAQERAEKVAIAIYRRSGEAPPPVKPPVNRPPNHPLEPPGGNVAPGTLSSFARWCGNVFRLADPILNLFRSAK